MSTILSDEKIKVGIADDHEIFRKGIKLALSTRPDVKILWEAENGKELINKINPKKPDVIIMDIHMPEMDGIEALKMLRTKYEEIKFIILTTFEDEKMISGIMEMGANAYLAKNTHPDEIYEAILTCIKDDFYFNRLVNNALIGKIRTRKTVSLMPPKFSENELKILKLLGEDKNTEEISRLIFLGPRTIEAIRQNMKTKVSAKTITGLVMYGIRNNLIN